MSEHSLTLYELEEELMQTAEYVSQMEAAGNEEDIAAALHSLQAYIENSVIKRDNCGRYLQSLLASEMAKEVEANRLIDSIEATRKKREKFSKYLLFIMSRLGVKKLEGQVFSFKAVPNPVKVIIDDESKIPAWYKTLAEPKPPELKPDKKSIKEAIQNGEEVPGAHLEQETQLVIDQ